MLALSLGVAGCGGPPATPPSPDAGHVETMLGTAENNVAFEGQSAFVTLVRAPIDVTGADVVLPPELEARTVVCRGDACAIVAEVLDTTPNSGTAIPSPIDGAVRQIVIETETARVTATVNVLPLDHISSVGGESVGNGTYFASSADFEAGSVLRGAADGEPVRWLVFGDTRIGGTIDVSADGSAPGPGGEEGAAVGATASGMSGAPDCASDFFDASCGGAGGDGDATSAGGGGAGAFTLVTLGRLDFAGSVVGHGGDGATGGEGGRVFVSGTEVATDVAIDVAGGVGTTNPGGEGASRVSGSTPIAEFILDTSTLEITGTSPGSTMIRAETIDGTALGASPVAADGTFALSITLPDGFSRIRLFELGADGTERRSFAGNHVELERRSSRMLPQPVGGLFDVVYLPPSP